MYSLISSSLYFSTNPLNSGNPSTSPVTLPILNNSLITPMARYTSLPGRTIIASSAFLAASLILTSMTTLYAFLSATQP
ncbi:MAG: hypothetical protein RXO22_08290 [Thermocladium sp.]